METILRGATRETVIGPGRPLVLIGDRISCVRNPHLAQAIRLGDMAPVRDEAQAQADAGAGVIAVHVAAPGIDEVRALPAAVQAAAQAVPLPLCIQTEDPAALAAALQVCPGKPLVGSISVKQVARTQLLPIAVERGAAVMAMACDEVGIPGCLEGRITLARDLLRWSLVAGVPRQDVILHPLAAPLADDPKAAETALQVIAHLARIEQLNMALEPAQVAQGLAGGDEVGEVFLAFGVRHGVTCAIVDPARYGSVARNIDLLLGRGVAA